MRHLHLLFILIFGMLSLPVHGAGTVTDSIASSGNNTIQKFQHKSALQASQDAIDQTIGDYRFTNENGIGISMAQLRGKPLVISMVYTSCYKICPMTIRHLAKVVNKARDAMGADSFSVAIIGFDTQYDNPQAMKHFAKLQGIDNDNWHILSADPDTITKLSKDLGFAFFTSPNGFDHVVQATVIDAQGKVYQQVYGEVFDTQLLVEPLLDLVLGRPKPDQTLLAGFLDKVRFFCTTYDPNTDSYHFDYSLFIGMFIGAAILFLTGGFIVRELRRHKHSSV